MAASQFALFIQVTHVWEMAAPASENTPSASTVNATGNATTFANGDTGETTWKFSTINGIEPSHAAMATAVSPQN